MYRKILTKRFIKEHPVSELSAYNISLFSFQNKELFAFSMDEFIQLDDQRKSLIEHHKELIEQANTAEEMASLFRKKLDIFARDRLIQKALTMEDALSPLLLRRYCTSMYTEFIEYAMRFWTESEKDYIPQLLAHYDNMRDPYAQAHVCTLIALKGTEEHIGKMLSEYNRFLLIDDAINETFAQAPLLALHELYYRYYAK